MRPQGNSSFIAAAAAVVGIVLSVLAGWSLYRAEEAAILSEFRTTVDARAASFYRELTINFEALYALAIPFADGATPSAAEFSMEARKILSRHHDIQALEWIPRVRGDQRSFHESERRRFSPEFFITERDDQGFMVSAGERGEYYPVYYVVPLIDNQAAFGFDLASDPVRKEALERSRDTGALVSTAGITMVQSSQEHRGFLAALPIYDGAHVTVTQRRDRLRGFILGAYRVAEVFDASLLDEPLHSIRLTLVDDSDGGTELHTHRLEDDRPVFEREVYRRTLPEIGGRTWAMVASPSTDFVSSRRSAFPVAVVLSGLVFVGLIVGYLKVAGKHTERVERAVIEKTRELADTNRQLEVFTRTDALTGIANRRHLDEYLGREWRRAVRNGSSVSVILADIDFFKDYNDTYGHSRGDECLKNVALAIQRSLRRPADFVARYGGEEFAIVVPESGDAAHVAERCREAVENLAIPHGGSEVSRFVTLSLGVSACVAPSHGSEPLQLMDSADRALYRAKQNGKNQVEAVGADGSLEKERLSA